jgi:hypothetical protein
MVIHCRPFDNNQATNQTGAWYWIGLPKSLLVNGKGNYGDCEVAARRLARSCCWQR